MSGFKKIIAAKIALIFLVSFIAAGFNHIGGCDESSEAIQTSTRTQSALSVAAQKSDFNDSKTPLQDVHFHCNHSACCAFLDTTPTSISKPTDMSIAYFSASLNLVGVDLSAIHRPPLA